jgi:pyrimidine-nucleoside phosphorylase/thymidine phosphorylase
MERIDHSRELAEAMCAIGADLGKRMVALITRMDQPLGRAVGNAVEVAECLECLKGGGPDDLVDLSIELAAEMVVMGGRAGSLVQARAICRRTIADGSALERFRRLVREQGGDPRVIDDPGLLPAPRRQVVLKAGEPGFVAALAARPVGHATMLLGAGRARMDSPVDHAVGVILHKKVGDAVGVGEPLCTLLVNDESRLQEATTLILGAYTIAAGPPVRQPLVIERIAATPAGGRGTPIASVKVGPDA